MSVYDEVRAYHEEHGDDFGQEKNRTIRYNAALSLFPRQYDSLLDVGCGSGRFKAWWGSTTPYTGIDLLTGTNVLDYDTAHDVVLALGILYRVPWEEQHRLLRHMWTLADKALIVQTLSAGDPDEHLVSPEEMFHLARHLTPNVAIRTDYLPNDFTIALYRGVCR